MAKAPLTSAAEAAKRKAADLKIAENSRRTMNTIGANIRKSRVLSKVSDRPYGPHPEGYTFKQAEAARAAHKAEIGKIKSKYEQQKGGDTRYFSDGGEGVEHRPAMVKHLTTVKPNEFMCPTKQRIIQANHSGRGTTAVGVSGRTPFHITSADKHPSVHPH